MNIRNLRVKAVFCTFSFLVSVSATSIAGANQNSAARKIDEYGLLQPDDEAARLDAFSIALDHEPMMHGYIVGYHQQSSPRGVLLRRIYGDRRYLAEVRGIEGARLSVMEGGCKESLTIELWMVPTDRRPPVSASEIPSTQTDVRQPYIFDEECVECDPPVNLDLYVFREGLKFFAQELNGNPGSQALILLRPSKHVSSSYLLKEARGVKKLLIANYQIPPRSILVKATRGKRRLAVAEMWVIPRGAGYPTERITTSCSGRAISRVSHAGLPLARFERAADAQRSALLSAYD